MLAPESHLHLSRDYGHETRAVTLEGEAAFLPTHDAKHPFMVRTAQAVTQDIGTTFEVSAYPEAPATRVVVAEEVQWMCGASRSRPGQLALVEGQGAPTVRAIGTSRPLLRVEDGTTGVRFGANVPEVLATIQAVVRCRVRAPDSRARRLPGT